MFAVVCRWGSHTETQLTCHIYFVRIPGDFGGVYDSAEVDEAAHKVVNRKIDIRSIGGCARLVPFTRAAKHNLVLRTPESKFSRPIDLHNMGETGAGVILDVGDKKSELRRILFGLSIQDAPPKFSRTKIITIAPRIMLVNQLPGRELQIQQKGCPDTITLSKNTPTAYNLPSAKPPVIMIRPVNTDNRNLNYHWSRGFELNPRDIERSAGIILVCTRSQLLNPPDDSSVKVSPYDVVREIVHVTVRIWNATMIVFFRDGFLHGNEVPMPKRMGLMKQDLERMPGGAQPTQEKMLTPAHGKIGKKLSMTSTDNCCLYYIDNRTPYPLQFHQRNSPYPYHDCVAAFTRYNQSTLQQHWILAST